MPTFLAELLSQIRGIWSRLDGGQRMTIASVTLAAFVGLGAIVWFAGQPDYENVYHAEDPSSLDDAVRALGAAGIGFKEDGSRILVERSLSGRAMQALMRAGVTGSRDPERSENLGNVTQDSMTRRDGLMARHNRRAEKAVELIDGVVNAYVTSSKPKRSVYSSLDAESRPSATVTLTLRRGEGFAPIARAAIPAVASALGLPESNVIVINARTKQRFSYDIDGNDGGVEFLAQQRKRGRELTERAQSWLDRLYEGRAIVTVTVDLDPEYSSSEEKIQPETPAITSEEKTKDSTTGGGGSGAGGDSSVTAATTTQSGSNGGAPSRSQKSETTNKTYEPFSGVRRRGMLTPDVRRMTVALVVDESVGGESAQLKKIEEAIKSTIGWLGARPGGLEDDFETLVEKFPELAEAEAGADDGGGDVLALAREFGPLVGQVLGVGLVLLFLRRLLKTTAPAAMRSTKSAAGTGGGAAKSDTERGGSVDLSALPPDERRRRMRADIETSISEDPAAFTRLLEGWLSEQRA